MIFTKFSIFFLDYFDENISMVTFNSTQFQGLS